ncbi:glycosyltransferase [Sphingomonas flavalba]|uniref:glycosyltransferase n=1 Tax=Sphingomonas flavalba TaxID=2559804 RepID=UPI00109DD827|nr:glycosyltransferase [Sphingomonas flavalba]
MTAGFMRASQPVILVSISYYLPGYKAGGPIRSVANIVEQLGEAFDFRIVTADRDLGDAQGYDGVSANAWTACGKAQVFYRAPGCRGWRALRKGLKKTRFDLLYLNSFFSVDSTLRFLLYRRLGLIARGPVLLAPRGELSRGALALKSSKKRIFIALAKAFGLYRNVTFHASSRYEAEDIKRVLGSASRVEVANNLTGHSAVPLSGQVSRGDGEPIRAIFLSRISPKKNLAGAIKILSKLRNVRLDLDVYGVLEDNVYWRQCQAEIAHLPDNILIHYREALHPDKVLATLSAYDFFFFPTLGENYGHVISEALAAGLPVLISDQTPWRDLKSKGVGADLPLDEPEAFRSWIRHFATLSPDERQEGRRAAQAFSSVRQTAADDLQANRALFYAAMGRPFDRNLIRSAQD